ncbi:AraC-type DNA-binding protein [Paracidovorax cattleyae]|uniref:AraC-type DNA-binding protein n=2 Tax=Paracidovorax cattleyae TaxID=80868 RepID=A0A1H0P5R1_9BURK|nr:helix-turn-helix transcriptional regulator [Paracidovorax cattleyae]AVS76112.1 AraC family transcriptional regulator [Paracidovorax cattleyae]SDP00301.1 AraC-type DNA-binding protein [Paracidovorax cattleyae]
MAPPSGAPVLRRGLCQLAQPALATVQHTPRFAFQDAALVQVREGQLDLVAGTQRLSVHGGSTLLLVDPGTCADLHKTPGGSTRRFRSVLLMLDAGLLESFQRGRMGCVPCAVPPAPFRAMPLDGDLARTFGHAVDGAGAACISDERLHHRLLELLCAVHERGHAFRPAPHHATTRRLRALLGAAPEQRWTAAQAGHALAMSEATLRRRLAAEQQRFDVLLADVRMQHALMLLQTTGWSIPRIALACGYQSRARFAERFRGRFGYLPSTVR